MSLQDPALDITTEDDPTPFGTASLFVGAAALGSVLGLIAPTLAERLSQGIDLTLLLMIFLLLFEITLGGLYKAFGNAKVIGIAWIANFAIIPVIGVAVASVFFSGNPVLFTGVMIYYLAPCTDWFLGFTRMARGDTELGAALIPINMLTQLALFPLWLWVLAKSTGLVDFAAMPGILLQWFVLPLLAAQALRFTLRNLGSVSKSDNVSSLLNRSVPFVLAVLIAKLFASNIATISSNGKVFVLVAGAVCLFFAITFVVGETLSRLGRLTRPQSVLLSMTTTARNAPLMLALTAIAIPDQPMILVAIVSGMLVEIPLLTLLKHIHLTRFQHRK